MKRRIDVLRRRGQRRHSDDLWVYIAGPYRGKNKKETMDNVQAARVAAIRVCRLGGFAVTPHLLCAGFDFEAGLDDRALELIGRDGHNFWLNNLLDLLRQCDVVYVHHNSPNSHGTQEEVKLAQFLNIPVVYTEQALYRLMIGEETNAD